MKNRIIEVLEGANQNQLADELGVSAQAVGKWKKSGKISKDNAISLAKCRGYSPEWLLTGEGLKKPDIIKAPHAGVNLDEDILTDFLEQLRPHDLSAREMAQIIVANYPEAQQNEKVNLQPSIRLVVNNAL